MIILKNDPKGKTNNSSVNYNEKCNLNVFLIECKYNKL